MANQIKSTFLETIAQHFGRLIKLADSQSLFKLAESDVRLYTRYSKIHAGDTTWYGLRERDLHELEGYPSLICFLWDGQQEPLIIPFSDYEEVFRSTAPAEDGQYKVQVLLHKDGTELYIAKAGRFNVDGFFGWSQLENLINASGLKGLPVLTHSQVQTLLGSIGVIKNFDIWVPQNDRNKMDWNLAKRFEYRENLPLGYDRVKDILQEVDVVWLQRGSHELRALFEVEHSTRIYSGLLRFNDIHLIAPNLHSRFSIVANDARRSLFVKQLNRPTFTMSGLNEICTFFEYADVYKWHSRLLDNKGGPA